MGTPLAGPSVLGGSSQACASRAWGSGVGAVLGASPGISGHSWREAGVAPDQARGSVLLLRGAMFLQVQGIRRVLGGPRASLKPDLVHPPPLS